MGLLDFFKKSGMLKAGSSSYNGNAKDRPVEMNDDPNPISGNDRVDDIEESAPDTDSSDDSSSDD